MKRFVLVMSLLGCGGSQHASDEPLTTDQQQCMDQHTRMNGYSTMTEPNRAKLNVQAEQALLAWVHDLSYEQCTDDEAAANKVKHRRAIVSLEMTGTDLPPDFGFDATRTRARGVVEISLIPSLAARPDVVRVGVEPT